MIGTSLKNKRLTFSLLIWLLLASSVAYSLDLECYLESNGACVQICDTSADDPCDEPLHLSPLTEDESVSSGVVATSSLGRSPDFLPVGLRAPPGPVLL